MEKKVIPKPPDMKFFEALNAIVDSKNIQSAAEYVIISLTVEEWRAIRDHVERASRPC